jgi:hypothetical protein
MNKHDLKSLLENISSTLMESEELPGDGGFDWGEDLQQLTRELFPNGTDTIPPLTPEELDPFAPPAWWTLGQKLWTWWVRNGMPPAGPMELNYGNIRPYFYYDAEGNLRQQPWSFPPDDPNYREEHRHDYGPPRLEPESNTESNTMNKQDLKSLLENIYHLLAEDDESPGWFSPFTKQFVPIPNPINPLSPIKPTLPTPPKTQSAKRLTQRLKPYSNTESNTMNKQELKSLLENIYEAMILPTLGDQALSNPSLLNPPQPLSPTPPPPPIDVVGPIPPMPLSPNGNPLFPNEEIWRLYYELYRRGRAAGGQGPYFQQWLMLRKAIYQWRQEQAELPLGTEWF